MSAGRIVCSGWGIGSQCVAPGAPGTSLTSHGPNQLPTYVALWPVGAVYIGTDQDPADLFGFGKWELVAKGVYGSCYAWKRVS